MSELDVMKEKIGHLKLWLGIFVVTDISLLGWLASNFPRAPWLMRLSNILAILVVSSLVWVFNRKIETTIERLRDL